MTSLLGIGMGSYSNCLSFVSAEERWASQYIIFENLGFLHRLRAQEGVLCPSLARMPVLLSMVSR